LIWISQAGGFDAKQKSDLKTLQHCKNINIFRAFRSPPQLQKLQFL